MKRSNTSNSSDSSISSSFKRPCLDTLMAKNYVVYSENPPKNYEFRVPFDLIDDEDFSSTVMYFKNDLRIFDNPALYRAARNAQENDRHLIGLFVLCLKEFKVHQFSDTKILLIYDCLINLRSNLLDRFGIPLVILTVEKPEDVPFVVKDFCKTVSCYAFYYNVQYEWDERKKDKLIESLLRREHSIVSFSFEDQCIVPVKTVKSGSGNDYTIFTPFKKAWIKIVEADIKKNLTVLDLIKLNYRNKSKDFIQQHQNYEDLIKEQISQLDDSNYRRGEWSKTEEEVIQSADDFIENRTSKYHNDRNFPGLKKGTSRLSPYLAVGLISPKYLIYKARQVNSGKLSSGSDGLVQWITEIVWREFYRHIIVAFPHVSRNKPFKLETSKIKWCESEELFEKWCRGETGYPLVDAAMNQLNATGWMHNRLRMVTSMFLTKDLLINWRWGEAYFMSKLIDGDLASNNGGWQWSASTGTDSQPYFRVFNPLLQSQKFDQDGAFIREWVPQLAKLNKKAIHDPYNILIKSEFNKLNYPKPICDHSKARVRAIEAFKKVLSRA